MINKLSKLRMKKKKKKILKIMS